MENESFGKQIILHIEENIGRGSTDLFNFIGANENHVFWSGRHNRNLISIRKTNTDLVEENLKVIESDIPNIQALSIHSMVFLDNGEYIFSGVTHSTASPFHSIVLIKTSNNLDIHWFKTYNISNDNHLASVEIRKYKQGQLVVLSEKVIFLIDLEGEILNKRTLNNPSGYENIEVFENHLFCVSRSGIITKLNDELEIVESVQFSDLVGYHYQGVIFINSFLVVLYRDQTTFKAIKIDLSLAFPNDLSVCVLSYSGNSVRVNVSNDSFYIFEETPDDGDNLSKLSHNLEIEWTKKIINLSRNFSSEKIYGNINSIIMALKLNGHVSFSNRVLYFKIDKDFESNLDCLKIESIVEKPSSLLNSTKNSYREKSLDINILASASRSFRDVDARVNSKQLCPSIFDVDRTEISADKYSMYGDGLDSVIISIQLVDYLGNPIVDNENQYSFSVNSTIGRVTFFEKVHNALFLYKLVSNAEYGEAIISFSIDSHISKETLSISVSKNIDLETSHLQSPHIYLQAAGSNGNDGSVEGVHLRWAFRNKLGNQHLPKGNYAANEFNFNKPDDFVKVFRTPYIKQQAAVNLRSAPSLVDDQNTLWIYQINDNKYFVRFLDQSHYRTVKTTVNPLTDPANFLLQYGDKLIEVESRNQLAFSVEIIADTVNSLSLIKTELLGADENKLSISKKLIARKTFNQSGISNAYQVAENIKSIRFTVSDCEVAEIRFELYSEHIAVANTSLAWQAVGEYALTQEDEVAVSRLEATENQINGKWPRFTDQSKTNVANYLDRWNGTREADDRNLKDIVSNYISLSNTSTNPTALEQLQFITEADGPESTETLEVSNLDMLFITGMDYHMARMLGMGDLDLSVSSGEKYIYLAEYHTQGNLGDGNDKREVQHLYASLPTGKTDERLPVPVDLAAPVMGIPKKDSEFSLTEENQAFITSKDGYTNTGKTRFISLYNQELPEYEYEDFYESEIAFNTSENTFPVNIGISYKEVGETEWQQPEISKNLNYLNAPDTAGDSFPESIPLGIPDPGEALYVHRETNAGTHIYSSYGINWFNRIRHSTVEHSVTTVFKPANSLIAPTMVNALHVVEESPLILTSASEQILLKENPNADKTLVRLLIEHQYSHESISYTLTEEDKLKYHDLLDENAVFPDSEEIFAEEIELFFRDHAPLNIRGKISTVTDWGEEGILSRITVTDYPIHSTGETVSPTLPGNYPMINFAGGVMVIGNEQFIIESIQGDDDRTHTQITSITVYKSQIGEAVRTKEEIDPSQTLTGPENTEDAIFMAIENMASTSSWETGAPHTLKVVMPFQDIHRELIYQSGASDEPDEILNKFRGILDPSANITKVEETIDAGDGDTDTLHKGTYKIEFTESLAQHPQFNAAGNSVEWYGGYIRVHTTNKPTGARKTLKVITMENVGDSAPLVVYAVDDSFQPVGDQSGINDYTTNEPIMDGPGISVNFYPGYRVYLYADADLGLIANKLQPPKGEGVQYTIFGSRTVDRLTEGEEYSPISTPAIMFTQEITEPKTPEKPAGSAYATRPDSFGKATYTLTTDIVSEPFALLYLRSNEDAILNALYQPTTVTVIKAQLASYGHDPYLTNRWQNLIDFQYTYATDDPVNENGKLGIYPPTEDGYRFPNPDNNTLFEMINSDVRKFNTENGESEEEKVPGSLIPDSIIVSGDQPEESTTLTDYLQLVIQNTFTPLTEIPVLYDQISDDPAYQPVNKKQVVRAKNGSLLSPSDPGYDIAPMARKLKDRSGDKVLYTDFTLDGTSDNLYFYTVREMGSTMQLSEFSDLLGPVTLINTKPPKAPEIVKAVSVLASVENSAGLSIIINAYPKDQRITKLKLYRTLDPAKSLSVRTMDLVKTADLNTEAQLDENTWKIIDEFLDLEFIPYSDPLYYRVIVTKEIEYLKFDAETGMEVKVYEDIPSMTSDLLVSTVVESESPEVPETSYSYNESPDTAADLNLKIHWDKTVHNGKYHLFKMNTQGNWLKIHEFSSNDSQAELLLADIPDLAQVNPTSGNTFAHFRVDAENSIGMLSKEGILLTIPGTRIYSAENTSEEQEQEGPL